MLKQEKWRQYGADGLDVKGIVLHNTGNLTKSARDLFNYLENECLTSSGTHFLIDYNEVIEVMPLSWRTWTTGKGNDWAFNYCISIEICDNINDELYKQGQDKAVAKIKELMETYNLTKDDIYFHNDFNERFYCPHILLDRYGSAKRFAIEELEREE